MTEVDAWREPTLAWQPPLRRGELQSRLDHSERLITWPAHPFESHPTDCFISDGAGWIWQRGVGAVRFSLTRPVLEAFSDPDADMAWYRQVVVRSWLPAIYPFWGRQVIHSSAAFRIGDSSVVAFSGASQAGKSTTAYGVAKIPGWQLISDDTLAFSISPAGALALHPLTNDLRLRPASAEFFDRSTRQPEPVEWPDGLLHLRAFYALQGDDDPSAPVAEFTRLRMSDGLPVLLQQAYALSFEIPKYNQQLMRDYAQLAALVPVFRLRYRRSFSVADELYAAVAAHAV